MSSALGIIAAHVIEKQEVALREAQRKIKEAQLNSGLGSVGGRLAMGRTDSLGVMMAVKRATKTMIKTNQNAHT